MTTFVFNDAGEALSLSNLLGKGGEGNVFEINDHPDLVAKLYLQPPDPGLHRKLQLMIANTDNSLRSFSAWPQSLLRSDSPTGRVVGFLMPKVTDARPLDELLSPEFRVFRFPQINYKGQVQIAENLARGVEIFHRNDTVIGDLHPGNILLTSAGVPQFIDCDSFQVKVGSETFRSTARLPLYLPPELLGADLDLVDGTPDHDAYCLAFLIFRCLMQGAYPHAGKYLGPDAKDLDTLIRESLYAYGPTAARRKMQAPSNVISPEELAPELAVLFERAFLLRKHRPSARDWVNALSSYRKQLVRCSVNASHFRVKPQPKCRFCSLRDAHNIEHFPNYNVDTILRANQNLAIVDLCQQLDQLTIPDVQASLPALPPPASPVILPADVEKSLRTQNNCVLVGLLGATLAVSGFASLLLLYIGLFFLLIAIAAFVSERLRSPAVIELTRLKELLESATFELALKEFQIQTSLSPLEQQIATIRSDVEPARVIIQQSIDARSKFYADLQAVHERTSRRAWLASHRISASVLPSVAQAEIQALQAAGMENAEFLTERRLKHVSGLSPSSVTILLSWKNQLEQAFQCPPIRSAMNPATFSEELREYHARRPAEDVVRNAVAKAGGIAAFARNQIQQNAGSLHDLRMRIQENTQVAEYVRKRLEGLTFYKDARVAGLLGFVFISGILIMIWNFKSATPNTAADTEQASVSSEVSGADVQLMATPTLDSRQSAAKTQSIRQVSLEKVKTEPARSDSDSYDKRPAAAVAFNESLQSGTPPPDPPSRPSSYRDTISFAESTRTVIDENEIDPLAGYFQAIDCYRQGKPEEGYRHLHDAIQKTNGRTPHEVFWRLERFQGPHRKQFEDARREIEAMFKE